MFDVTRCKPEDFANVTSYKAALWAGETCNKVLDLVATGHQFFFEGEEITPVFRFTYGQHFEISLQASDNAYIFFVGDVHDAVKGEWKVWCTKKDLTEFFKKFKFVHPKEFKSLV